MKIISGTDINRSHWQRFVRRHERFTHDLRWREIYQRAYGLRPYYLAAQDGPELVGTLPLVRLPGFCTQSQLVSLPFLNYAGVTAVSPEIVTALEQAALATASRARAGNVVIRIRADHPDEPEETERGYSQLIKLLPRDEQSLWANLRGEKRTSIRKSWRCGVEIKRGRALLPVFFKIYQSAMLGFGSPPHSAGWFRAIMRAFAQDVEIIVAYHKGIPVASHFLIMWGDTCHGMYGVSLNKYKKYGPSDSLYWQAMLLAIERGKTRFNLGRSVIGGGSYYYKKHFGGVPYRLRYERFCARGSRELLPQRGTVIASRIWRKMPMCLSNALGPKVRRYVLPGFGARTL